jgi:chromosomal replication initiation ATPase DnaA
MARPDDMARQLSLGLPPAASPGAPFLVTPATAAAHAAVMGPAGWPQGRLTLVGAEGSGKSHLARLWAAREGALLVDTAGLAGLAPPGPAAALVIDDADRIAPAQEEPLFHLVNRLAGNGGRLLLTARQPPARWPLALPDLASRLQASAVVTLQDPDDRLLSLLLARFMADRQIVPRAGVIPYLVSRMERSAAAARQIAEALDAAALAEGRGVTRDLARAVLDKSGEGAR